MVYLECQKCGHVIKSRVKSTKKKRECNNAPDGMSRCYGSEWSEVTKDDYENYAGTNGAELMDDDNLQLKRNPEAFKPVPSNMGTDDFAQMEAGYLKEREMENEALKMELQRVRYENALKYRSGYAPKSNSNNGDSKEVQALRDKIHSMELQQIQATQNAQIGELKNAIIQMNTDMNRPHPNPIQNLMDSISMLQKSPLAGDGNSDSIQLLKNQGQYQDNSMKLIGKELGAINGAGSRIADIYERQLEWQMKQSIRDNTPPGTPEIAPQPATSEELQKVAEKSVGTEQFITRLTHDLKVKHSNPATPQPTGTYYCSSCSWQSGYGVAHRDDSFVGREHRQDYEMKLK